MDNENKNVVSVEENDTDKAMQSFLTGSNDYESEKKVDEAPAGIKLGKYEGFIAALAVFAAALWTISNYGAALICAFAVLLTVITKPGKDTVHTVAANGLALGLMIVIRATLNVSAIIFETVMNASKPESTYGSGYADWVSTFNSFNNVMTVVSAMVHVAVFVIFVINAYCFLSKKRTFIFGKTAAAISDKEDEE